MERRAFLAGANPARQPSLQPVAAGEWTVHRYANRAVEAAQVVEELIQLARDMREASAWGTALGLSGDEPAFYDALETNHSAVKVLGDETLRDIALGWAV